MPSVAGTRKAMLANAVRAAAPIRNANLSFRDLLEVRLTAPDRSHPFTPDPHLRRIRAIINFAS
jgi:hypothetical protein